MYCPQTRRGPMARKAIDTHAQSFVENEELVLLILKTFAYAFRHYALSNTVYVSV